MTLDVHVKIINYSPISLQSVPRVPARGDVFHTYPTAFQCIIVQILPYKYDSTEIKVYGEAITSHYTTKESSLVSSCSHIGSHCLVLIQTPPRRSTATFTYWIFISMMVVYKLSSQYGGPGLFATIHWNYASILFRQSVTLMDSKLELLQRHSERTCLYQ